MPFEITLRERPAGYALASASGVEGSLLPFCEREFCTSEEGAHFLERLEGWPTGLLQQLPAKAKARPSTVDNLLAVILPDLRTTVWLNELKIVLEARSAHAIAAGEALTLDDLSDVERLILPPDINIPPEAALVWIFSVGWRKGLFFDFSPLNAQGVVRSYEHEPLFGAFWAYVARQHLFTLSEAGWHHLFEQGWFPFASLSNELLKTLVKRASNNDPIDVLIPKVSAELEEKLPRMRQSWERVSAFEPHLAIFDRAAERFADGDFMSATALLYPRIEGLLRSLHDSRGEETAPTSKHLAEELRHPIEGLHEFSWLLPERFRSYVRGVYFRRFKPGVEERFSRHTVSHGVARAVSFNQEKACLGFLIVHQLFYFSSKQP